MTTLTAIQRRVGVVPDGIWGAKTAAAIWTALGPVSNEMRDPAKFFAGVRRITGPLDQAQVDMIDLLLARAAGWPVAWLAYALATAWHEARLRPIEEIGRGSGRAYGEPGRNGGQIAYGRGLVQLTWDENYETADRELGLGGALIADYAKALEPTIAADILINGMEAGWFTGRALAQFLPDALGTERQFRAARRIVNGTDQAELIAGQAFIFQDAIVAGKWA